MITAGLRHRLLASSMLLAALFAVEPAAQERSRILPIFAPLATGPENAILISSMSTGQFVRVTELSDAGIQRGPTTGGLSFHNPWHFSLDAGRRLVVADRDNGRIIAMDDVAGTNWAAFSGSGSSAIGGPNTQIVATLVDPAGRIYISGGRITRIDNMSGAGAVTMLPGSASTSFSNPKGMALDRQGRLYVVDNGNGRVIRYDDMDGRGYVAFGSIGYGASQFNRPEGIALDSANRIYITDNENNRIVRINDMSGSGWTTLGTYGHGADQFSGPHDIKIDAADRIWIADTGNSRVVRVNTMGGDGWIAFGSQELQGRELLLNGNKGIQVIGLGPSLGYTSILPRLSLGSGFSTSLIAVNTRAQGVDTQLSFVSGASGPCPAQSVNCSTPLSVSVNGVSGSTFTQRIESMGASRFEVTGAASTTGYARLRSGDDVNGIALLRLLRGAAIASEAAVRLSPPANRFTIYIDQTGGASTGYSIVNAAPEGAGNPLFGTAQVTMTLRSKDGSVVQSRTQSVFPGLSFTELASAGFPEAGPGFEGSLEFSTGVTNKLIEAVALRYDNATSDGLTAMPVMGERETPTPEEVGGSPSGPPPADTTTLLFPHIGDGGSYRTNFILANTSDASTTATLEFFSSDGLPMSLPIGGVPRTRHTVALNARGVDQFTTDGTAPAVSWGWARVTANGTVGGSAILQTVVAGKITSEAGVPACVPASHFTTYVDNLGPAKSGLAVSNPNTSSVGILFNLRNASGNVVSSAERTLPALGNLAQFFTQIFPGFTDFEGTLELQTSGASLCGVGIRYDNADSGVFTTMPVTRLP